MKIVFDITSAMLYYVSCQGKQQKGNKMLVKWNYTADVIFKDSNNRFGLWETEIKATNPSELYEIVTDKINSLAPSGYQVAGVTIFKDFRGLTVPEEEFQVGRKYFNYVL